MSAYSQPAAIGLNILTSQCRSRPITSVSPSSHYVGVDQEITYGDNQTVLPSGSGILDTGTTLILLATGKSLH